MYMENLPHINLKRTTIAITQRCTLKCKHCLAFIPYLNNPKDMTLNEIKRSLETYFSIVDTVEVFSITGGEPLMHRELVKIFENVFKYSMQIKDTIDLVTNGTIQIKEGILDFLEDNSEKVRVIISDYGVLSPYVSEITESLRERNIKYRVAKYYGEDLIYNGWVDFSDHSYKHTTKSEINAQGQRCIFRQGRYYLITEGELHPCSRSAWRMKSEIIPVLTNQKINLLNDLIDIKGEKEKLLELDKMIALTSCAYCNGVHEESERIKPAEQI